METDFSAKLAKIQYTLQHILTVVLQRTFALLYTVYYPRPGYVTCCGIIGSGMFWIGGILLSFPPTNILSDITEDHGIMIYFLASNILPFETFIHIALLFLASITYWKATNILSFCMTKCGCFYLFIHSIFSLGVICKYIFIFGDTLTHDMMLIPFIIIFWFLGPSFIGFVVANKEHSTNDELTYKWKQITTDGQYQQLHSDDTTLGEEDPIVHDEQFVNQQYWSYYIYVLLAFNVLWFIIYCSLQSIHNIYLIDSGLSCDTLTIGDWFSGYTQSFTMAFHRAFIMACIYNINFRPWCHNTVYVAVGGTLTSLAVHVSYLCIYGHANDMYSALSLLLIVTKVIIFTMILFCEYKIYKLLSPKPDNEYNKHQIVRKRPSMFDILRFDGHLTRKQRTGLYLITISKTIFIVSMQMEVVFMLFISAYLVKDHHVYNPWTLFNKLLLWSFHLCVIYIHAIVVSVQFNDSYIRASRLLSTFNVALLIFAVWNVMYVSYSIYVSTTSTKYIYLDYIVVLFCCIRALTALGAWIGFSKLETIEPFTTQTYNYDDIPTEKDNKLSIRYVQGYLMLLCMYFIGYMYRYSYDWNGDLFALNGCNWSIICSEMPGYGLLFHSGLLNMIFIWDGGISKRWAPTWDLSRMFLLFISILGTVQVMSCIVMYYTKNYIFTTCEILVLIVLSIWIAVSLKMCAKIHSLDPVFLFKPKLFI